MATEVDICNLALAYLGDTATVASLDPPEGSAQAEMCARFYPIARDTLLQSNVVAWGFATKISAPLATLASNPSEYTFAYATPADVLKILAILPATAGRSPDYTSESTATGERVIYTNQEGASVHYVAWIQDPARFPPLFTTALAWHLASMIAGPLIKGRDGAQESQRAAAMSQYYINQAAVADARQRRVDPEHLVDWISVRS